MNACCCIKKFVENSFSVVDYGFQQILLNRTKKVFKIEALSALNN